MCTPACEQKQIQQLQAQKTKMKNIELTTEYAGTKYKLTPPKDD